MRTGIVLDRRYEAHDTGPGHPERPERIRAIRELMRAYRRAGLVDVEPRLATDAEIALNHDPAHVARVAATAQRARAAFDADTPVCSESHATAALAAGGYLRLLEAILAGDVDNGFAFVRPPGHHAEPDRAMGFCLFNNVAIGARWLRTRGVGRIVIVDWDVHHGNGTQESFWDDPDTLYVSTHQYPFYPGTGAASEVGRGAAAGRTLNVPLPAGCGDDEYVAAFTELIAPVAEQFRPELVLISAGFDADYRDPLAGMQATDAGFRAMTRVLMRVAERHASGRIAAILEGGYDLDALRAAVPAVLDELAGAELGEALPAPTPRGRVLAEARAAQKPFWELPE
ncbi:MAG: histone deacetylase [Deltaproteobacteria bacterium]|nr:histone deacetylase [Deltaproteobacteria bacterium]